MSDAQANRPSSIAGPSSAGRAQFVLCVLVALLLAALVWAMPRVTGDLWMALAAGKDVLAGKVGQPDDWSFTTDGRVWMNQNWLSGLVLYLAYSGLGELGLLAVKALLVGGSGAFIAMACQRRGANWSMAVLIAGATLLACIGYMELRPNLVTLTLAPLVLWLLYISQDRPAIAWACAALVGLWANLHGGWVLGAGLMLLWSVCIILVPARRAGMGAQLRRYYALPLGAVLAVVLAGVASPYGLANLREPFTIASKVWRDVDEWRPIFSEGRFGSSLEFQVVVLVLMVFTGIRIWITNRSPGEHEHAFTGPQASRAIFEMVLAMAIVTMALSARRFAPLAMILLAPMIAVQAQWVLGRLGARGQRVGIYVMLALVAAASVPMAWRVVRHYAGGNPTGGGDTFLRKMVYYDEFPHEAADFIDANGIEGNAFNEWRWEGFLHLRAPGVKLFFGGRAQQVYLPSTYLMAADIVRSEQPEKLLAKVGADLVIVPVLPVYEQMVARLCYEKGSRWAIVYFDGETMILASLDSPRTARLVGAAARRELKYPDNGIAQSSFAMFVTCDLAGADPARVREELAAAIALRPAPILYTTLRALFQQFFPQPQELDGLVTYLERENLRLEKMDYHKRGGMLILLSRATVLDTLTQLYRRSNRPDAATRCQGQLQQVRDTLEDVSGKW